MKTPATADQSWPVVFRRTTAGAATTERRPCAAAGIQVMAGEQSSAK